MADEYTPTTERVRQRWLEAYEYERDMPGKIREKYPDEVLAQFDRWLVEHERQVAERAWDEGHLVHGADGWPREDGYCRISGGCIAVNPYRKEQS